MEFIYCTITAARNTGHGTCQKSTYLLITLYGIRVFKLIELLKSENRNVLFKLCKFIKLAFNHRNSLISR